MPIQLTKPWSPGDADPNAGEGYPHLQLSALYHNGITFAVTLEWQFGTASGQYYENWQRGAASPTKSLDVPGAQVVPLWSQKPKDGESVGEAIRRVTYEFLISEGYVAGTIVDNPPLPPVVEPADASSNTSEASPAEPQGDDTPATQPAASSEAPAASSSSSEGTQEAAPSSSAAAPAGDSTKASPAASGDTASTSAN